MAEIKTLKHPEFTYTNIHCSFHINTLRPRQNARHSQTTFSSTFSWMKMFEFRLKVHWSLFLRVELTIFQHWFGLWLGAVQATSHYLNQWWFDYRRIYASLGLNELSAKIQNSWLFTPRTKSKHATTSKKLKTIYSRVSWASSILEGTKLWWRNTLLICWEITYHWNCWSLI